MHPKDVAKFIAWSKAMVAGATVDKPNYGKNRSGQTRSGSTTRSRKKRRRRRKSQGNNAKKD